MASTLRENLNNSYYINTNRLTNRPNRIKVLVEDELDVPFWYDVLTYDDCVRVAKSADICFDFEKYIRNFSEIIYPLLVWSLYLEHVNYKMQCISFPRINFDELIPCDKHIYQASVQDILNKLAENINKRVDYYKTLFKFDSENVIEIFKKTLKAKGLEPYNAYQFLKGHDLYKFLVATALKPLMQEMVSRHRKKISTSNATSKDIENRMKQYNKQLSDVETELSGNYEYKRHCLFFQKMQEDIRRIWS